MGGARILIFRKSTKPVKRYVQSDIKIERY